MNTFRIGIVLLFKKAFCVLLVFGWLNMFNVSFNGHCKCPTGLVDRVHLLHLSYCTYAYVMQMLVIIIFMNQ